MCQAGEWKAVSIAAGCVALLPGYTLEQATCSLVKAIVHRMVHLQCTCNAFTPTLSVMTIIALTVWVQLPMHDLHVLLIASTFVLKSSTCCKLHLCFMPEAIPWIPYPPADTYCKLCFILQVMGHNGSSSVRNTLVYKLRARDSAVPDFYDDLSRGAYHWCELR